jgi:hypothetical protein
MALCLQFPSAKYVSLKFIISVFYLTIGYFQLDFLLLFNKDILSKAMWKGLTQSLEDFYKDRASSRIKEF